MGARSVGTVDPRPLAGLDLGVLDLDREYGDSDEGVIHGTSESNPMERLLRNVLGGDVGGLRIEAYDGTTLGSAAAATTVRIVSPDFFRRVIAGRGSELAFSRSYVAGDLQIDGDVYDVVGLRHRIGKVAASKSFLQDLANVLEVRNVSDLVKLRPPPPPPEEASVGGVLHSRARDSKAVSGHYDLSNEFYRLFLGSSMAYSCGVFETVADSLEDAQLNKHDLICRKLGLRPGMRLLDIGCGWGSMVIHAAEHYGVDAVGVTISNEQRLLAQQRVNEAGLAGRVQIRLQDYRDVSDRPFDAISSVGMFEHVGQKRLAAYFGKIESLLLPGGRLLNHAINRSVTARSSRIDPNGFMGRFVFPDGELLEAGQVVSAINSHGLEVRHMESLREHYALTLRHWVGRLEENWEEAVGLTSAGRARVWRLYMAGAAIGFESNELNLTQILATKSVDGSSRLGLRPHW